MPRMGNMLRWLRLLKMLRRLLKMLKMLKVLKVLKVLMVSALGMLLKAPERIARVHRLRFLLLAALLVLALLLAYLEFVALGTVWKDTLLRPWAGVVSSQHGAKRWGFTDYGIEVEQDGSRQLPLSWRPELKLIGENCPQQYKGQANLHVFEDWCGSSTHQLRKNLHFPLYPHWRTTVQKLAVSPRWTNYGLRIFGYLHPFEDGEYLFAVASDDNSEFWLSMDESPLNIQLLAYVGQTGTEWAAPGEYGKYTSQISHPVQLEVRKQYFFEVIYKQNDRSTDHVEVAWRLNRGGLNFKIIDSLYISLYANESGLKMDEVEHIPQSAATRARSPWQHNRQPIDMLREDPRDSFYQLPLMDNIYLRNTLSHCSYNPSYLIKGLPLMRFQGLQFVRLSSVYPNDYTRLAHMDNDKCFYHESDFLESFGFYKYMKMDVPEMRDFEGHKGNDKVDMDFIDPNEENVDLDTADEIFQNEAPRGKHPVKVETPWKPSNQPNNGNILYIFRGNRRLPLSFLTVRFGQSWSRSPMKRLPAGQDGWFPQTTSSITVIPENAESLHADHINTKVLPMKNLPSPAWAFDASVTKAMESPVAKQEVAMQLHQLPLADHLTWLDGQAFYYKPGKKRFTETNHDWLLLRIKRSMKEYHGPEALSRGGVGEAAPQDFAYNREGSERPWMGRDNGNRGSPTIPNTIFDHEVNWAQTFDASPTDFHLLRTDMIDLHCNVSGNLLLSSSDALPVVNAFMHELNRMNQGHFYLIRVVNVEKRRDGYKAGRYLVELELQDQNGVRLRVSQYVYVVWQRQYVDESEPEVMEPFLCLPLRFFWNPSATVHFIVPVKNQARWVQRFIVEMEALYRMTQDRNFNIIVTDYSSSDMDVEQALRNSALPNYQYVKLLGNFERSAGLQAGIDLIIDDHSIVFLCDLHISFPPSIIDNIRKHCVESKMAFAPIVLRLDCGSTPQDPRGYWEVNGFGLLAIYKSDLDSIGGMNTRDFREHWGGEDWELVERILQAGLEVERIYLRNFMHHYHSKRGMWNRSFRAI